LLDNEGKTTLLKAIAGHTSGGTIEGSIRINGYAVGEHASRTYKVPLARYA
jgi:ABC-type multidrug transport system ATPase subunit